MIDCVVIVSGGMDSVTLLHTLVRKKERHPAVISFMYGQKHLREIDCARRNVQALGLASHLVLDLSPFRSVFATSALVGDTVEIPTIEAVQGDPQPARRGVERDPRAGDPTPDDEDVERLVRHSAQGGCAIEAHRTRLSSRSSGSRSRANDPGARQQKEHPWCRRLASTCPDSAAN